MVRQWLARPGCRIKLICQPAYAVTHNTVYATFAQFTEAIDDFFTRRLRREWKIWRDTIADNFRIISYQEFRVLE